MLAQSPARCSRARQGADRRRTGRVGRQRMITIPVEDWIFGVAALVGGVLLLITVVFDDIVGGLLDGFGFDIGGTSFTPVLLGLHRHVRGGRPVRDPGARPPRRAGGDRRRRVGRRRARRIAGGPVRRR